MEQIWWPLMRERNESGWGSVGEAGRSKRTRGKYFVDKILVLK